MRLNAEAIHGIRAIVLWVVRSAGLVLVGWGATMASGHLLFGMLYSGRLNGAWSSWHGIPEDYNIYGGPPLVVFGLILMVCGRRLARWIVAVPETGCPICGYRAAGIVCTECGYHLNPGPVAGASGSMTGLKAPAGRA